MQGRFKRLVHWLLEGSVLGQDRAPEDIFSPVGTVGHTGWSTYDGSQLIPLYEDIDEGCVDEMIQPVRPLGRFIPTMNDCHTFVDQVLKHCAMRKSYSTMPRQ